MKSENVSLYPTIYHALLKQARISGKQVEITNGPTWNDTERLFDLLGDEQLTILYDDKGTIAFQLEDAGCDVTFYVVTKKNESIVYMSSNDSGCALMLDEGSKVIWNDLKIPGAEEDKDAKDYHDDCASRDE